MKTVIKHNNGRIIGTQTWVEGVMYPKDSIIVNGIYTPPIGKICTIDTNTGVVTEVDKELSLNEIKANKKSKLLKAQKRELRNFIGTTAEFEEASYAVQEKEARTWNADNNIDTPFIDGLIVSRNFGETKQEFVDKILANSDAYIEFYTAQLGKFQRLVKAIDNAMTIDEVNAIERQGA